MSNEFWNYVNVFGVFTEVKDSHNVWMFVAVQSFKLWHHQLFIDFVLTKFSFRYCLDCTKWLRLIVHSFVYNTKRAFSKDSSELIRFLNWGNFTELAKLFKIKFCFNCSSNRVFFLFIIRICWTSQSKVIRRFFLVTIFLNQGIKPSLDYQPMTLSWFLIE